MNQELCLSDDDDDEDDAAADENGAEVESVCSYSQAVRRMVGVKTTDPSVASSNCSLNRYWCKVSCKVQKNSVLDQ